MKKGRMVDFGFATDLMLKVRMKEGRKDITEGRQEGYNGRKE